MFDVVVGTYSENAGEDACGDDVAFALSFVDCFCWFWPDCYDLSARTASYVSPEGIKRSHQLSYLVRRRLLVVLLMVGCYG